MKLIETGCYDELCQRETSSLDEEKSIKESSNKKSKFFSFFARTKPKPDASSNIKDKPSFLKKLFNKPISQQKCVLEVSNLPMSSEQNKDNPLLSKINNMDTNKLGVWTIEEELSSYVNSE